jgi:hypothetical protein
MKNKPPSNIGWGERDNPRRGGPPWPPLLNLRIQETEARINLVKNITARPSIVNTKSVALASRSVVILAKWF